MCTLCLTTHSTTDVTLMVARRPGAERAQPVETLGEEERVQRLRDNVDTFLRRVVDQRVSGGS